MRRECLSVGRSKGLNKMERHYYTQYSEHLQREMHVLVYGYTGVPIIVFPCQDSMCDNFENFGMIDVLQDYIDGGKIQLFSVDTWIRRAGPTHGVIRAIVPGCRNAIIVIS